MQRKQYNRFSTLAAGMQMWNDQSSLPMRHYYVPATTGFAAIGNMSNDDEKRPWFER